MATFVALGCGACVTGPGNLGGQDEGNAEEGSSDGSGDDGGPGSDSTGDEESGGSSGGEETAGEPVQCTDYVPGQCDSICLEDPVLEAIIREGLGLDDDDVLTPALAQSVTYVRTDDTVDVTSLGGLECFTGLVTLGFNDDSFTDLSPVADLPSLEDLIIRRTPVAAVPALASPVLIQLWLIDTQVSDLSALEGSIMRELLVTGSPVDSLDAVASMANLVRLEASDTQVSDLTPVAAAPALSFVELNDAAITDVSPLADNAAIYHLWLAGNGISDIAPLATMPNLEWIHVSGNPVSDLGPVDGMTQVVWVGLSDTQVTDLSPLLGTSVESIEVDRIPIADPQQVWTLPLLRTVSAEGIGLTSLDGVPAAVEWLHVADNQIVDVSPIDGLVELTELDLRDNDVVDLTSIQGAPIFDQSCRPFDITGNPLDATSANTVIPALCDAQIIVASDVNACPQVEACGPID